MFLRDVFKDESAPAYAVMIAAIRKYGLESLEWEPELLREEIDKDYDIKISDLQQDKLQAAMSTLTTDHFEHDWRVFEVCGHLFNNQSIDHDDLCPLEAEEIAVAIAEFSLIRQDTIDDDEKIVYGDEVNAYVGQLFYDYGLHKAPNIFKTAIMPKSNKANDKDKNEALKEIFDTHVTYILEYLEKFE